jgi:cell division septum initiation protein DivIVA
MNDNSDLLPNLVHEDAFEMQMRGYSRRQVDEFIARTRSQIRDLEQRLARALDEGEELRRDLAITRQQAMGARPAHEELSERMAQILKLAEDEAKSQKAKVAEEIARQRNDAHAEADRTRTEAREQAERMLTAAQEQAERAITSARAEAEKTVSAARAEAERTITEASKKADDTLSTAKAQAKKALDDATARATAIHDGAERRLNLLSTRHAETIKRLSDILEGVSTLVTAETARMSLEEEVDQATAKARTSPGSPGAAAAPRPAVPKTGQAPPTQAPPTQARPPQPPAQPAQAQPIPPQPMQPQPAQAQRVQAQRVQAQRVQAQPAQAPDKPAQAHGAAAGSPEPTEGVRVMKGNAE